MPKANLYLPLSISLLACADGGDTPNVERSSIDDSVDPCEDFYQYACGGWIANNPLRPTAAANTRFQDPFYDAVPALRELVEKDASGLVPGRNAGLIGAFHRACMNAPLSFSGRDHVRAVAEATAAVSTKEGLAAQIYQTSTMGSFSLIAIGSKVDPGTGDRVINAIYPVGFELPDRSYYLDDEHASLRAVYLDHMRQLTLMVLGRSVDAQAALRVETAIARATRPRDDPSTPVELFHPMSSQEIEALAPNFPWAQLWQANQRTGLDRIDVPYPEYLTALDEIFRSMPLEDLREYLIWQWVEDRADDLDQAVLDLEFSFWKRFNGRTEPSSTAWNCFLDTIDIYGLAVAEQYLGADGTSEAAVAATTMSVNILAAFRGRLGASEWLDGATKDEALAKLDRIALQIGHPTVWPTYDGLESGSVSYFEQKNAISAWYQARSRMRVGQAPSRDDWIGAPLEPNARYSRVDNIVNVSELFLRPPFLIEGQLPARGYGALGTIIAHEISHGFDDAGRYYDRNGVVRDWWSDQSDQAFKERTACLVDQFSGYEALPGRFVNGELTLGENIADLAGMVLAYQALLAADGIQEGDGEFDGRQVFFLGHAQSFCENLRPELTERLLLTDPHAPHRARVNLAVANMPEFAEAFSCDAGAPMAPADRCAVW